MASSAEVPKQVKIKAPSFFARIQKVGGPSLFKKGAHLRFQEVLCVSIEEHGIKGAVANRTLTGAKEISQLFHFGGQGVAFEDALAQMQGALAALKMKEVEFVGVVGSHSAVVRNIEIPSLDANEIRQILNLQATRHTPYARSEIIVDYLNLGVFKNVYTKVLLIIVPRAAVMKLYEVALKLSLNLKKIFFAPEAVVRVLAKRPILAAEKAPVVLVHIDTSGSEFMVLSKGVLLFVRSIPIGAQHFAVAKEGYLTRFVEELKKSLETYQNDNIDQQPSAMFLVGATHGLEDLEDLAQDHLRVQVKWLLEAQETPIRQDLKDKHFDGKTSYLTVMGPALSSEELGGDLTPEENKVKRVLEERSKEIIKTGMLALIFIGLICAYFLSTLFFQTARLDQLKKRYEPLKKEAQALEQTYRHVQAVKSNLKNQGKSLEVLATMAEAMAADLYLREIRFDAEGKLALKGSAFAKPSIFELIDKMQGSQLFQNVQTKHITGRVEDGKELADFEIVAVI